MIKSTTRILIVMVTLALTATIGMWSGKAHGGSDASLQAADPDQAHCVTISSGASTDSTMQTRATVGQTVIGRTSDGSVFVHAGIHGCSALRTLEPLFADFDHNRLIDLNDLDDMVGCVGGPDAGVVTACEIGIADGDGDIDMRDLAELQRVFYGSP